jgi:vacuolar-type H+-ATPase subunit C/Vma6
MLDPRTPFMTAILKSQEVQLVGREHLEQLSASGDPRAALRDTDIGRWLEGARWRDAAERDLALWEYLAQQLETLELRRFFPPEARRFGRAYLFKYDVGNVKAVLQGLELEQAPRLLPIGLLHARRRLDELAAVQSREALDEVLTSVGFRRLALALRPFRGSAGRRARLAMDAALENEYHRGLQHAVRGLRGGHVLALAAGLVLDLQNLALLCRLLAQGAGPAEIEGFVTGGERLDAADLKDALAHGLHDLPRRLEVELYRDIAAEAVAAYERSGSVAVMEAVIERRRLAALQGLLAPQVASAAVMAWYIVLKEIELRNVRLVFTALEDGLALDEIRRHLLM